MDICEMCTTPNPVPPVQPAAKPPKEEAAEEVEEEEEPKPRVTSSSLLYHQLRSRALKALCKLIQEPKPAAELFKSGMLPLLLSMSVRPTELEGFQSLTGMERTEERLLELSKQAAQGMTEDTYRFMQRHKGNALEASPFSHLGLHLPNALDPGSSRAMNFDGDGLTRATLSTSKESSFGVVRSNFLIPNTLPAYYYEITVEKKGLVRTDASSWEVAIGLFRSGFPLSGFPGSNSSYAFSGRTGEIHCTNSSKTTRSTFGQAFGEGDVIGCGWNLRKNTVFFTKNGELLTAKDAPTTTNAFENVTGRFYPVVWLENDQAEVSFNFGQHPFLFDFASVLPPGYLSAGGKAPAAPLLSAAEMRRRTMAEELVMMMGGSFPSMLCEIALERSADDVQRAANWLIEYGYRELDRMGNETIRASQIAEDERKLKLTGVLPDKDKEPDSDDEEDLAEWLGGSGSDARQSASNYLDDEIEEDLPLGLERAELNQVAQPAARARGAPPGEGSSGMNMDNLKVDEIVPGQVLTVSELAPSISIINQYNVDGELGDGNARIAQFLGRTGVVTGVNVNNKSVQLMFYNTAKVRGWIVCCCVCTVS
jgi:hypothetical protein